MSIWRNLPWVSIIIIIIILHYCLIAICFQSKMHFWSLRNSSISFSSLYTSWPCTTIWWWSWRRGKDGNNFVPLQNNESKSLTCLLNLLVIGGGLLLIHLSLLSTQPYIHISIFIHPFISTFSWDAYQSLNSIACWH